MKWTNIYTTGFLWNLLLNVGETCSIIYESYQYWKQFSFYMVWNVKAARHVYSRLTVLFLIHQISSQRYWERVPQLTLVAMTRNLTSLDSKLTLKMVLSKVQANFFPLLFKIILNKGTNFMKKKLVHSSLEMTRY